MFPTKQMHFLTFVGQNAYLAADLRVVIKITKKSLKIVINLLICI